MIAARVRRTIVERALLSRGDGVLVGCSGGPDSAALLSVLAALADELGIRVRAASVDHGLRAEAGRDVEAARAQATAVGVPFSALSVTVAGGASLQARAREARYRCLLTHRDRLGLSHLAVGHTRDDQAETVLMRMLRGAGIRGLAGVSPARSDGVVRPLIDCARGEVARYAAAQGFPIALDPSNADSRFERVRIRTQVIPVLLREDEQLVSHLAQIADEAHQLSSWLDARAAERLGQLGGARETIRLSTEDAAAPWLPSLLRQWLHQTAGLSPGRSQLEQLRRGLGAPAEIWLSGGWAVLASGSGTLSLRPGACPPNGP